RLGHLDPRAERILAEGRRPIGEHVAEFLASLRAAGRNSQHVEQTARYVNEILALARIERLPDLTPSRVVVGIESFKTKGITPPNAKHQRPGRTPSTRTVEARMTAIKAFSRWAWRDGRTADYDLKALAKPRDPGDRRRVRRVHSDVELRNPIEHTRIAP